MPANVFECTQLAVFATHHDDIVATDIGCQVVPGLGDFVDVADQLPPPEEKCVVLELEYFRIRVGPGRERWCPALTIGQTALSVAGFDHRHKLLVPKA
jgi:hypothetical protein